jgi:hypothetical protein
MSQIRNSDGWWINTEIFREEGKHFLKYGYYCADPANSYAFEEYWDEQLNRCINGYSTGGAFITGNHYFYLNFCPIKLTLDSYDAALETTDGVVKKKAGQKILSLPDFWDGDYEYFHIVDIAKNGCTPEYLKSLHLTYIIKDSDLGGGLNVIVGKARRKGFSYKNAAMCANIYNTVPDSLTIIGAFDKKYLYPRGTMGMASSYLNHLNKHTGWVKAREYVDKQEHRRASYKEMIGGAAVETGYLSEIQALTFKDNPDAARGKDSALILYEEAGKFPNLIESFNATKDSAADGIFQTGQSLIFGTGGDMEKDTVDFSKMFYAPELYDAISFENIWDDNAKGTHCSFFFPDRKNLIGFYDVHGNSHEQKAQDYEDAQREKLKNKSLVVLHHRVQEHPNKPSEAFLTVNFNDFPVEEMSARRNVILRDNLHLKRGTPGMMYRDADTGKPRFKPDLEKKLEPLWRYKLESPNIEGCVVIYEPPIPSLNYMDYKGGYDPYRQQQAKTSTSLGSTYLYRGPIIGKDPCPKIVATYIGRPPTDDFYHRQLELLLEWYNEMELMYENEVTTVFKYFEKRRKLKLLAGQPNKVIGKLISNSKVSRGYGCHMNEKLKDGGEKYIKQFLLKEWDFTTDGTPITTIDCIDDPGLLDELIEYSRKGNFDRVMSFMQLMFQIEEDDDIVRAGDKIITTQAEQLNLLLPNLFARK